MYDLCIIGGGPGGYFAAERAAQGGLRTLLIEQNKIGGVCLNEGCIPTKTMLYSAKQYEAAKKGEPYGVTVKEVELNHAAVLSRKEKIVRQLIGGVSTALKNLGVEVLNAQAEILERSEQNFSIRASETIYQAKNLIIATGSKTAFPPIPGLKEALDSGFAFTSKEALSLESVPKSMAILGGGVIGLELAAYYHAAGSEVTIVEMLPAIAPGFDRDLTKILARSYSQKGIRIETDCTVREVSGKKLLCEQKGKPLEIECESLLVAIGRKPNLDNLGLEKLETVYDAGGIKIDSFCQTSIPKLYAIGDVNGKMMLAHVAYREAEVAVNHILNRDTPMQYHAVPSVLYTNPEIAGVGLTQEMAAEKGLDVEVRKISMNYSGRYMAENEKGNGICKLIIERQTQKLLGIAMIANYASEIILAATLMVGKEMQISELKELIFPHPSVGEAIKEALYL